MYYNDKTVLLASKHQKEQAMAEPFLQRLGCRLLVKDFDSDQFGTFTGEVPRPAAPLETCIQKAKTAAQQQGFQLALASEGSFGPHPANPFRPIAQEIMAFWDAEQGWVISEQIWVSKTNYAMRTISVDSDIAGFLQQVAFPSHALTLQTSPAKQLVAKGINSQADLDLALKTGFARSPELILATDMRAMMNPTRMQSLAELADQLALRIASSCPNCQAPGFGMTAVQGHLLCALCASPSRFHALEHWSCVRCDYVERRPRKDGLKAADPSYCDLCNP